jgi:hypothetical protein
MPHELAGVHRGAWKLGLFGRLQPAREDVTVSSPFHRQVTVIEDSTGDWRVEYFDDDGALPGTIPNKSGRPSAWKQPAGASKEGRHSNEDDR